LTSGSVRDLLPIVVMAPTRFNRKRREPYKSTYTWYFPKEGWMVIKAIAFLSDIGVRSESRTHQLE
jgi:hypothetical protein